MNAEWHLLSLSWEDVLSIATLIGLISSGIYRALLGRLRQEFPDREAYDATAKKLDERLDTSEVKLSSMPSHSDIRLLGDRVGRVEGGVDVARSGIDSILREQAGQSRMIELMLKHQLAGDEA